MSTSHQIPTTYAALAAMRDAGGWYVRKRRRYTPALWRISERGALAPARPSDVESWLCERFPGYHGLTRSELRWSAQEVIAEARYHDYGLTVIDDELLALLS